MSESDKDILKYREETNKMKLLRLILYIMSLLSLIFGGIFFFSCITGQISLKIVGTIIALILIIASVLFFKVARKTKKLDNIGQLKSKFTFKNKTILCFLAIVLIFISAFGLYVIQDTKNDSTENYKTYAYKKIYTCQIPKSWEHKKIDGIDYYYKNPDDSTDGMLYFDYTDNSYLSITDKDNFESFLSGLKSSDEYSGHLICDDKELGKISAKQITCTYKIDGIEYYGVSTLFDCGTGFATISFLTHEKGDDSDYYNNILDSLVVKKVHSFESSETTTTEEPTTIATTEESTTEDDYDYDTDDDSSDWDDDSDSTESSDDIHNKIKKDFISNCKTYPYKSLLRYPSKYESKAVKYTVEIAQIMDDGSDKYYRAYISKDGDSDLSSEFYIKDLRSSGASDYFNIVKGDTITVYGHFNGMKSLTRAISGVSEDVPCIYMQYADLK